MVHAARRLGFDSTSITTSVSNPRWDGGGGGKWAGRRSPMHGQEDGVHELKDAALIPQHNKR